MIIRGNGATSVVYTDAWYRMIRVTWDPPVTAPGRCQSNPHGNDSGSQRNPLPLNILLIDGIAMHPQDTPWGTHRTVAQ
jgi:hypothetical protein